MSPTAEAQLKAFEKRLTALERSLATVEAKSRSLGDLAGLEARLKTVEAKSRSLDLAGLEARLKTVEKTLQSVISSSTSSKDLEVLASKLDAKIKKREEKLAAAVVVANKNLVDLRDRVYAGHSALRDKVVEELKQREAEMKAGDKKLNALKSTLEVTEKRVSEVSWKEREEAHRQMIREATKENERRIKEAKDEVEKIIAKTTTERLDSIQKALLARITALEAK